MSPAESIFLDFNLPNAATWFYFALLLAVALFFKFGRLLSVRNADVLGLFLLVPGLLILLKAHSLAGQVLPLKPALGGPFVGLPESWLPGWYWFGYLWLLVGSGLMVLRCLLDLALERRPALGPNLNFGGLAWLGGAVFVCLIVVTIRNSVGPAHQLGKRSLTMAQTQQGAEDLVERRITGDRQPREEVAFWVERGMAITGHLAIVFALVLIGWRHFQDLEAGMAAATLYLLLPYTAYLGGQVHHVLPAAALIWAVAVYRYPTVAGLLIGLAVASPYFPALLFPLWCGFYRGRGVGRFAGAFVVVAAVLWLTGDLRNSLWLAISDWSSPSTDLVGFWSGMRWAWAYRLPVLVAYLAFALAVFFWPSPKDLAHLIALSAALLIGIQFWYADQGGVYVLWYLPLFVLMTLRPTLADRRPPPTPEEMEWLRRAGRWVWGWLSPLLTGWLKPRKQPVRVPNGEG